jgi:RHS repeat-associated protein
MKSLNIIFAVLLLSIQCINITAQTAQKNITLTAATSSGDYNARDWISLSPGFSFAPASPTPLVTKVVELRWNYSNTNDGWWPFITMNSQMFSGSQLPSPHTFYNFIETIDDLIEIISSVYKTTDGWSYNSIPWFDGQYIIVRIEHASNFAIGDNHNFNSLTLLQDYSPATDGTFAARIDEGLVFDAEYLAVPPNSDRDLNKSLSVGSISGGLDVSSTGAATYTIPIEVPPGTAGMQPAVSLSYSSQSGNGIAGFGWNISGASAITRCGKTQYYDGIIGGVNLDNNDRYALDGNRLVNLSGTYGGNNIEYRTVNESFAVIKSYDSNSDNQPEYFKVWTKDGKVIEFGNSSDSKILSNNKALFWCINKVTDVNGNYIEYKYEIVDNELVLSEINYTGTSSSIPYNKIAFSYSNRTIDQNSRGLAGYQLNNKLLLRKISVTSEEKPVAEYVLNYIDDNNFSQLAQVDLIKDNQKLNPTIFTYGNPSTMLISSASGLIIPGGTTDITKKYWSSGDMNNDGFDDLICVFKNEADNNCYPFVYYALPSTTGVPAFDPYPHSFYHFPVGAFEEKGFSIYNTGIRAVDLNGNGNKELVVPIFDREFQDKDVIWVNAVFDQYRANGSAISYSEDLQLTTDEMPAYAIKDLNSDGTDDIVLVENSQSDGRYYGKIIYYYPAPTPTDPEAISRTRADFSIYLNGIPRFIFVNDYNSDGLQDVMVITEGERCYIYNNVNGVISTTSANNFSLGPVDLIKEGDFNGDGLIDFIFRWKNSATWYLLINNGNNSFTTKYLPVIEAIDNADYDDTQDDVIVEDFNNDGKSDIITRDARYSSSVFQIGVVKWYASTGDYFTCVSTISSTIKEYSYGKYFVSGDFNGDGRSEMMNYGYDFYDGIGSGSWVLYHTFNYNFNAYLLNKVTDGLNMKYNIDYRPLDYSNINDDHFYTKGTTEVYPVSDIQPPLYCVKATNLYDGTNNFNKTYTYAKATVHKQGLGFLGFSEVTQTNVSLGVKTISAFSKKTVVNGTTYYTGGLVNQKTQTVLGADISEIQNTYEVTEIDAVNKRIMPWIKESTTTDHLHGGAIKIFTKNVINADGNPESVELQNLEGTTLVAKTTSLYSGYADRITANSDANPYPNMASSVVVNKTHKDEPGVTYSRTSNFTYNNKGQVLTMVNDPGTTNTLTTTNEYYTSGAMLGQLKKCTLSASGLASRYKEYTYDAKGRFITKSINSLGYFTTAEYDSKNGNLLAHNDILGNGTSFYYDAWGRPSETLLPTGTEITSSTNWYSGTALPKAILYKTLTQEGTGPVTAYYDRLGREIRTSVKNADGQNVFTDKEYNTKGQLLRVSMPYFEGTAPSSIKWTVYTYDAFNRLDMEDFNGCKITDYQYTGATTKIMNTSVTPNRWTEKTIDATGNIKSASDAGGTILYYYKANGQVGQMQAPGSTVSIGYDDFGRQDTLDDPDAGVITYSYNAYGELRSQTDAENNNFQMTYDQLGRLLTRTGSEGTTQYNYFEAGNGKGQIRLITGPTGIYNSYDYDEFGRNTSITEYVDASHNFITANTFDELGRITGIKYPTGFSISNIYDQYGYLKSVKREDNGTTIWQSNSMDQFGNTTSAALGNGLSITRGFDQYGLPASIQTGNLQNMQYSYSVITGDLNWRKDLLTGRNFTENFTYDQLDRLTSCGGSNGINYYDNGSIQTKYGAGTYDYIGPQPHAMTNLTNSPIVAPDNMAITYNAIKKIATITEGSNALLVTYGVDDERVKTVSTEGTTTRSRYFAEGYEEEWITGATNSSKKIHYISGGDGLTALYIIDQNNTGKMYYVSIDPLGSIVLLTNQNGSWAEEYSFDAWGRRRSPTNWTNYNVSAPTISYRGYTGHEHLDAFALINMNGRVYDPVLGMFFSPDNYVQAPDFTQNFNRYGYCLNNPLKYTDPSGEYIPFFAFPTIGWSKDGGFSVGLTVGIGVPGIASIQANGSYSFKSDELSGSLSASYYYNTISTSYSNSSGWNVGYSVGLSSGNSPISTNFLSAGYSYNLSNNLSSCNISAWSYNEFDGWSFNPSFSANPVYYSSEGGFSYLGQGIVERNKPQSDLYLASYAPGGDPSTYIDENGNRVPIMDGSGGVKVIGNTEYYYSSKGKLSYIIVDRAHLKQPNLSSEIYYRSANGVNDIAYEGGYNTAYNSNAIVRNTFYVMNIISAGNVKKTDFMYLWIVGYNQARYDYRNSYMNFFDYEKYK